MTYSYASGGTLVQEVLSPSTEEANAGNDIHLTREVEASLASPSRQKRMELRVSDDFLHALDLLAGDENLTRADIIRRAVGLYARARVEQNNGRYLGFVGLQDGQLQIDELVSF
jgi:predicted transcriptional regulator